MKIFIGFISVCCIAALLLTVGSDIPVVKNVKNKLLGESFTLEQGVKDLSNQAESVADQLSNSIPMTEKKYKIYTWVDDKGKKHFGSSVPEKYRSADNGVEISRMNTIPSTASAQDHHIANP